MVDALDYNEDWETANSMVNLLEYNERLDEYWMDDLIFLQIRHYYNSLPQKQFDSNYEDY